jgi:hypothetical protein
MKNEEKFGLHITQAYASLIKSEVLVKYPHFFFEKGAISYDYDNEMYVYSGFSSEEIAILKEAEKTLLQHFHSRYAA